MRFINNLRDAHSDLISRWIMIFGIAGQGDPKDGKQFRRCRDRIDLQDNLRPHPVPGWPLTWLKSSAVQGLSATSSRSATSGG